MELPTKAKCKRLVLKRVNISQNTTGMCRRNPHAHQQEHDKIYHRKSCSSTERRCDTDLFILTRKDIHQLLREKSNCATIYMIPYIKFAYVFVQICRYSYFTVNVQKGLEV